MSSAKANGFTRFVHSRLFSNFILAVVFLNAFVIGLQSYPTIDANYGTILHTVDLICLGIFTIEILMKLSADRLKYFKDGWNVFDFTIVALSLILISSSFVSVLRILRVLRVLRTISSVPTLRRIITSLFMAIPTIANIAILMIIVFFIYGVTGTAFFAEASPQYFGDLSKSLITLFQIATFDDWANIYRPIAEFSGLALVYFVSFIMVAVFIILNLVVGEIVNNATKISEEVQEDLASIEKEVQEIKVDASEIAMLRKELQELKALIVEDRNQQKLSS